MNAMADAPHGKSSRLSNWIHVTLGLVLGVIFIVLVVRNVNFADVYAVISRATLLPLVIATAAFVIDFLLRAARFWAMLLMATGRRFAFGPTISPFIASFGMSDVLPLRVGDGFRVVWFSRHFDISPGTVIGTMVIERILDLGTIVILGVVALALLDENAPSAIVWNFQVALGLAAIASFALLFAPALLRKILSKTLGWFEFGWVRTIDGALAATSAAVVQIGSWQRLAWLAAVSLLLWLLESLVVIGAWWSLGGSLGALLEPFTAFVFSTLGTLVPSLPGHFGSFEYFGIQAFSLTGVDAAIAVSVIFLAHLILWAPTAIFGVCWLLFRAPRRGRKTAEGNLP